MNMTTDERIKKLDEMIASIDQTIAIADAYLYMVAIFVGLFALLPIIAYFLR